MAFSIDEYEVRSYWRKFSERWSTAVGYLALALAISLGYWGLDRNSTSDIQRNEDTVNEVVCGLKFFVSDLIESGSDREAVLEKLYARLPVSVGCVEKIDPTKETAP